MAVPSMCLSILTLAVATTGMAFCDPSLQQESATFPVQLGPQSCSWRYATEACCLSGGGLIQYRYRVKTPYSPHSFIGDGPSVTCSKAQLPKCPPCEQKKPCGHRNGTWLFDSSAGWSPAPVGAVMLESQPHEAANATAEVSARQTCSREGFQAKCPGEGKDAKLSLWQAFPHPSHTSSHELHDQAPVPL